VRLLLVHPDWEALVNNRWRTVDIVVASVIAVAFGVIFWAWGLLYNGPADAVPLPARALLYGVWLVPGVLGGLVIRKPGAAFYTETLAALVSVALGTSWGWTLVLQGPVEAAGAELAFAIFAYRVWRLPAAVLSALLAGIAATVFDKIYWYPENSWSSFGLPYILIGTVSALALAGIGSVYLTRALAQTGVLDRFPAGRERAAV
jgi:energy-coupling factor transport system substrate-specific component